MAGSEKATMDLLLWRHAEAVDVDARGGDDLARRLTARGVKQAKSVGGWFIGHRPRQLRIVVSPAVRTMQTADALGLDYEIDRRLAPEAPPADLLAAAGWPDAGGAVLLVGHQPTLGRLAGLLLTGKEIDLSIKKGALWWFRRDGDGTVLQAVMPASLTG